MGYLRVLGLLAILIFSGLLTACSDDSATAAPAASYTGNTAQASVTADNSEALAEAAFDGAAPGDSGLASTTSDMPKEDTAQLVGLAGSLRAALSKTDM